ncbi:hypothetical protein YC2023_107721 [Brassica napus]
MILLHACRSKTNEKRGRTFRGQIVITKDTSFCRWKSPSPLPSVLSVNLLYYITSNDVKTGTLSKLEPSSSKFISLSPEATSYRETRNEEKETRVLIIMHDLFRPIQKKPSPETSHPARPKTLAKYRSATCLCGPGPRSRFDFAISSEDTVIVNPDKTGSQIRFNRESDSNSGWVNAKIQLKLNQIKVHIEMIKIRDRRPNEPAKLSFGLPVKQSISISMWKRMAELHKLKSNLTPKVIRILQLTFSLQQVELAVITELNA